MRNKFFINVLLIQLIGLSVKCQNVHPNNFNIRDSIAVNKFINESTLCDKLAYVEKHKTFFCKEVGFYNLILKNISKESNTEIDIPFATGGSPIPENKRESILQDQIGKIKKLKCKN